MSNEQESQRIEYWTADKIPNDEALMTVLVGKGIITVEEINQAKEALAKVKNDLLNEELKDNPGMAALAGMMARAASGNQGLGGIFGEFFSGKKDS